jgi:transcriptional regulator with XRE-family HTH domain
MVFVRKTNPRLLFGKQLRAMRLERGLSQEKLAELADLHRNYVGMLERASQSASLDAICKLAAALKVRPAELLSNLP